jgi:DNA-binding CsgD family transcriptional regulator
MSILRRLLHWLGLRPRSDSRHYQISESLYVTLNTLAKHEGRSAQELIPDLVAAGLNQYRSIDKHWSNWESLSQREQEITAFTCLGWTNRQIAARLSLSPDTIKTHIRRVLKKFGLNSKDELRHTLEDWDFSSWL